MMRYCLSQVWRVLLELLSCHAECAPSASAASSSDPNICYKSVDTPAGPRLVISVSKTYIRLKELILEKKHLEKEMNRMKQLNVHLECKLGEQVTNKNLTFPFPYYLTKQFFKLIPAYVSRKSDYRRYRRN